MKVVNSSVWEREVEEIVGRKFGKRAREVEKEFWCGEAAGRAELGVCRLLH